MSFAIAAYVLYGMCTTVGQLAGGSEFGPPAVRAARIRVLGLRNPDLALDAGNNITFGLLENGCPVNPALQMAGDQGQASAVYLPPNAVANGYFLEISDGPDAADPVRWVVEVSGSGPSQSTADGGDQWRAVGASGWYGPYPVGELFPQIAYPTPAQRGERVVVDCRPSWQWLLAEVATSAVSAAGFLLYGVCGALQRERAAVASVFFLFALSAVLRIMAAAGSFAVADWRSATQWWAEALPDTLLTLSIAFFQRKIVFSAILFGLLKVLSSVMTRVCFRSFSISCFCIDPPKQDVFMSDAL